MIMAVAMIGILSAFNNRQNPQWVVPDNYVKMTNPNQPDARSLKAGKSFFMLYCKDCHGKKGLGDGMKASYLAKPPANLTTAAVQNQSDGLLFYKISEGHNQMPRNKKDIPDKADIWDIVNYLRTIVVKAK